MVATLADLHGLFVIDWFYLHHDNHQISIYQNIFTDKCFLAAHVALAQ